jgi:transposase
MVDTDGRALARQAHPANVQDGDGAVPLLKASRMSFPFVKLAFADSAYDAKPVRDDTVIAIEVVRKIADQVGFVVLPRRWVVERFFAWINRNRRLAKDFEATVASAEADRTGPLMDYCTGLLMPGERKSVEPITSIVAPARVAAAHHADSGRSGRGIAGRGELRLETYFERAKRRVRSITDAA